MSRTAHANRAVTGHPVHAKNGVLSMSEAKDTTETKPEHVPTMPWREGRGMFHALVRSGKWWVIPAISPATERLANRLATIAGAGNRQAMILKEFNFSCQFVRKSAVPARRVATELRRNGVELRRSELIEVLNKRDVLIVITSVDDVDASFGWMLTNALLDLIDFDESEAA